MVWRRDRYWDPFDIMREIQEEIDAIFRDFMRGPRIWSYREPRESIAISESWREPFVDIFDRGDRFVITVELPGVRKEDIKLRVT
ncbi:MAG: Hsp20/alpha crystallin family protein, partial [Thermococcus sp.]